MLNIDVTKLPITDRVVPFCKVISLGSGNAPKFITVELPNSDGARINTWWDGGGKSLAVDDYVVIQRQGTDKRYRIIGTDRSTSNAVSGGLWPTYQKEKRIDGSTGAITEFSDDFSGACAASTSGDIILLGPGDHACGGVTPPAGVIVLGMGIDVSRLVGDAVQYTIICSASIEMWDLTILRKNEYASAGDTSAVHAPSTITTEATAPYFNRVKLHNQYTSGAYVSGRFGSALKPDGAVISEFCQFLMEDQRTSLAQAYLVYSSITTGINPVRLIHGEGKFDTAATLELGIAFVQSSTGRRDVQVRAGSYEGEEFVSNGAIDIALQDTRLPTPGAFFTTSSGGRFYARYQDSNNDQWFWSSTAKFTANFTKSPINILPRSVAPSSPVTDDIYLDDGTNTADGQVGLRYYNGASWQDLTGGSGSGIGQNLLYDTVFSDASFPESTSSASMTDDTYFNLWNVIHNAATGPTLSRQTGGASDPFEYYLRCALATNSSRAGILLFLEAKDAKALRGKEVSLSFDIWSPTITGMRASVLEWSGTADSITSDVVSSWVDADPTLAANWAYCTGDPGSSFTVTSSRDRVERNGFTIGSSINNLAIFIRTATEDSGELFNIARVKLEVGATATDFIARLVEEETAKIQRYYLPFGAGLFGSWSAATTCYLGSAVLPVTMRATPSVSLTTTTPNVAEFTTGGIVNRGGTGSTVSLGTSNNVNVTLIVDGFTGATASNPAMATNNWFKLDARL